jgi:16S rRNA processing protein RimM
MVDLGKPVTLAVISGAHGIAGEVRLKLFTDDIAALKRHKIYNGGVLHLKNVKPNKAGAIARFAEIADRNAAEAARGTLLNVPRSTLPPLPEGEYYHIDLIDLPVHTEDGGAIGMVCAVENFGAGDIIEIVKPDDKKFMMPLKFADVLTEKIVIADGFAE